MMQSTVLLLGLFAASISAVPLDQQPLTADLSGDAQISAELLSATPNTLHGRFLHITDFHPDRYYKAGSAIDEGAGSCHHGKGPAGYFGQEGSECDSPISLVNETFRWIEDNLKDQIDFVVWTGDSVRHDNDERIPRTDDEIVEVNQFMSQKWLELFGTRKNPTGPGSIPRVSVPVIPTFGNNDITPHNIFRAGPNAWTKKFAEVWHHFIPEDQRHSFVEGGWFLSEVIPGKLVVISLNTMYFFESNSAVDGCNDKSEPGYEHMEWLRVQLQLLRSRGMKAILTGHVAPARSQEKTNWDETCWQKYTLWTDRYRDVVVGGLYGHMNVDHFMLQDSHDVEIEGAKKATSGPVTTLSKEDYLVSLRNQWSDLPSPPSGIFDHLATIDESTEVGPTKKGKKVKQSKGKKKEKKRRKYLKKIGGEWAERYSVSLVSPSVVPNFFPTLRVVEYNITGLETSVFENQFDYLDTDDSSVLAMEEPSPETQKTKKNKHKKKPDFKIPNGPSRAAPPGPAYSNQPLTFLSWTQYFANLTQLNHRVGSEGEEPRIKYEVEYSTRDKGVCQMKDLTVRSFLELATRIGEEGAVSKDIESDPAVNKKKNVNEAWRTFLARAFTGFVDVDDLDVDMERPVQ